MTRTAPRRGGFTLVELLVAIAIAIVVLSLAVYLVNSATFDSYKVVGAGDRLSQWQMQSKNRALRDKLPRGVRLFVTTDPAAPGVNVVKECAFIEQPEAWFPPESASASASRFQILYPWNGTTYPNTQQRPREPGRAFLTLTANDLSSFQSADIKKDDFIYIPDLRQSFRLTADPVVAGGMNVPTAAAGETVYELQLSSLPDLGAAHSNATTQGNTATYQASAGSGGGFGFLRKPQVLLGEPTLPLASGMVVDVVQSRDGSGTSGLALTTDTNGNQYYDILFAPGGGVIGSASGFIGLLLRDINKYPQALTLPADFDKAGEMIIVAVYPRTGATATHAVSSGTDPFQFAKDAINTGL